MPRTANRSLVRNAHCARARGGFSPRLAWFGVAEPAETRSPLTFAEFWPIHASSGSAPAAGGGIGKKEADAGTRFPPEGLEPGQDRGCEDRPPGPGNRASGFAVGMELMGISPGGEGQEEDFVKLSKGCVV